MTFQAPSRYPGYTGHWRSLGPLSSVKFRNLCFKVWVSLRNGPGLLQSSLGLHLHPDARHARAHPAILTRSTVAVHAFTLNQDLVGQESAVGRVYTVAVTWFQAVDSDALVQDS